MPVDLNQKFFSLIFFSPKEGAGGSSPSGAASLNLSVANSPLEKLEFLAQWLPVPFVHLTPPRSC